MRSPNFGPLAEALIRKVIADRGMSPGCSLRHTFQTEISAVTGVKYVAALSSELSPTRLSLIAVGLKAGDSVWCSALMPAEVVHCLLDLGGVPRFFDVDMFGNLDLSLLEDTLRCTSEIDLPRLIITNDFYGIPVDMHKVNRLKCQFNFKWISDSSNAFGSTRGGVHAGKGADLTIFRFRSHNLINLAQTFVLQTDESGIIYSLYESLRKENACRALDYNPDELMLFTNEFDAAIGLDQIINLTSTLQINRSIFGYYETFLRNIYGVDLIHDRESQPNCARIAVRITREQTGLTADDMMKELSKNNIESMTSSRFAHLIHHNTASCKANFQNCDMLKTNILLLPAGGNLTSDEIRRICCSIIDVVRGKFRKMIKPYLIV